MFTLIKVVVSFKTHWRDKDYNLSLLGDSIVMILISPNPSVFLYFVIQQIENDNKDIESGRGLTLRPKERWGRLIRSYERDWESDRGYREHRDLL